VRILLQGVQQSVSPASKYQPSFIITDDYCILYYFGEHIDQQFEGLRILCHQYNRLQTPQLREILSASHHHINMSHISQSSAACRSSLVSRDRLAYRDERGAHLWHESELEPLGGVLHIKVGPQHI
jgi:hypothetical protein